MRTTPYENVTIYSNQSERTPTHDFLQRLATDPQTVAPFEILGESIVPNLATAPAILQGTFIQISNIGPADAVLQLVYAPTVPFNFGPSAQNVSLNANFITSDLKIFDYTDDFKKIPRLSILVPRNQTVITGLQYLVIPKPPSDASLTAPKPVGPEALGNRGFVQFGAVKGSVFNLTTTVRQVFVKSLSAPTDIISATAYSVPLSTGPVYEGRYTVAEIFGDS